jgi:tetratricopeptide (TPR) repeat protein
MKLEWAQKELESLNSIPQYKYIIEASIAGPNLKASTSIPEADELYNDAAKLTEKAGQLFILKDDDTLRIALDKYNQLIKRFPSSDKIDDAAYNAGKIYEYFKDYSIALLYYQRTYQWDRQTIYPAKFRAAYTLDKHLKQRAQALELYKEALREIGDEKLHRHWQNYARGRIKELTKSDEKLD